MFVCDAGGKKQKKKTRTLHPTRDVYSCVIGGRGIRCRYSLKIFKCIYIFWRAIYHRANTRRTGILTKRSALTSVTHARRGRGSGTRGRTIEIGFTIRAVYAGVTMRICFIYLFYFIFSLCSNFLFRGKLMARLDTEPSAFFARALQRPRRRSSRDLGRRAASDEFRHNTEAHKSCNHTWPSVPGVGLTLYNNIL